MIKTGDLTTRQKKIGIVIIAIFILYLIIVIAIGFISGRKGKESTSHFFLAGRGLPWFVIGFSLIGFLVEILSGQNFNEYCKEHIFEPLEMYNSSFRLRDHDIDSIAVPYEHKNGGYFRHPHYGAHLVYPAITLRTSTEEFSHFLIAHMNNGVWNGVRILEESTVELMHRAHFSPNDKYNYGLGWTIKKKSIWKNGIWP